MLESQYLKGQNVPNAPIIWVTGKTVHLIQSISFFFLFKEIQSFEFP